MRGRLSEILVKIKRKIADKNYEYFFLLTIIIICAISGKMPNRSKIKGTRVEREITKLLTELGLEAKRVPLSGAVGGDLSGDIHIKLPCYSEKFIAEVKARKTSLLTVRKWLNNKDMLFVQDNRQEPLVIMPFKTFEQLMLIYKYQEIAGEQESIVC